MASYITIIFIHLFKNWNWHEVGFGIQWFHSTALNSTLIISSTHKHQHKKQTTTTKKNDPMSLLCLGGKEINWIGATYRYLKVLHYKERRKETGGKKRRKIGIIQLPDSSIFWINLKHLKGKVKYVFHLWLVVISNSPPGFTHGKARFTMIEMSFSMEKLSRIPIRISNKQHHSPLLGSISALLIASITHITFKIWDWLFPESASQK